MFLTATEIDSIIATAKRMAARLGMKFEIDKDKPNALKGMNGIQVKVDAKRNIATLHAFLDGRYATWVEFDAEQLDGLIGLLEDARSTLTKE